MSNKQFLRSRCTFSCAGWNKNNIQRINASHCFYLQHSLVKQFEILVLCIRLYKKKYYQEQKKKLLFIYMKGTLPLHHKYAKTTRSACYIKLYPVMTKQYSM